MDSEEWLITENYEPTTYNLLQQTRKDEDNMKNLTLKVGILIVTRGKLLLIKEKSSHDNEYHWNIIKGTYEPEKDGSLLETAKREAREEVGATIKNLQLFNVFEVERGEKSIIQINFLASPIGNSFRLAPIHVQRGRGENIIEIKFFSKGELKGMKRKNFLTERTYQTVKSWVTPGGKLFRLL